MLEMEQLHCREPNRRPGRGQSTQQQWNKGKSRTGVESFTLYLKEDYDYCYSTL